MTYVNLFSYQRTEIFEKMPVKTHFSLWLKFVTARSIDHESVVTASRQSFGQKATKVATTTPFREILILTLHATRGGDAIEMKRTLLFYI
jgi:hypothetical protein